MSGRASSRTSPDLVVTGMGMVSCHGCDLEEQRRAVEAGRPRLSEVDREAGYHRLHGSRLAALVDPDCYKAILPPIKARRMSPPSRFAVVATDLALADAGWEGPLSVEGERDEASTGNETAVVFGTSFGPSSYTERILRQILLESPQAASPMLFTESVANAPAAQVALRHECRGPNITVTQREASAVLALIEAVGLLRAGRARRALVGGVEELNPLLHSILDRFGALAGSRAFSRRTPRPFDLDEAARPQDANRDGFNAGEGAGVLVIERAEDAAERGARVRARIGAHARAFEPSAPSTSWAAQPSPAVVGRLGQELAEVLGGVERFVAGANGSIPGDAYEAALAEAVGVRAPGLTPKAVVGEQGMAGLVGGLFALEGTETRRATDYVPFSSAAVVQPAVSSEPVRSVLVSACASGGAIGWVGFDAP